MFRQTKLKGFVSSSKPLDEHVEEILSAQFEKDFDDICVLDDPHFIANLVKHLEDEGLSQLSEDIVLKSVWRVKTKRLSPVMMRQRLAMKAIIKQDAELLPKLQEICFRYKRSSVAFNDALDEISGNFEKLGFVDAPSVNQLIQVCEGFSLIPKATENKKNLNPLILRDWNPPTMHSLELCVETTGKACVPKQKFVIHYDEKGVPHPTFVAAETWEEECRSYLESVKQKILSMASYRFGVPVNEEVDYDEADFETVAYYGFPYPLLRQDGWRPLEYVDLANPEYRCGSEELARAVFGEENVFVPNLSIPSLRGMRDDICHYTGVMLRGAFNGASNAVDLIDFLDNWFRANDKNPSHRQLQQMDEFRRLERISLSPLHESFVKAFPTGTREYFEHVCKSKRIKPE